MKVLHIEDSEALALIMECKYPSLTITRAETLKAANEILETEGFDAILLDLTLPDSKGLDTVKAMVNRGMPVVVVTGNPSKDCQKASLRLGVADYIPKRGMEDIDVAERLEMAIERHRQTKSRYASFSFGDIEPMKRFISGPPFGGRGCERREAVVA